MQAKERVAVIGSGSWATAIVKILLEGQEQVGWWVREPEVERHLLTHGHNPHYLSSVSFDPRRLHFEKTLPELVAWAEVLVVVVPSAYLGVWLKDLDGGFGDRIVVTAVKGIEPVEHLTSSEFLKKHHGVSYSRMGVVCGPCHAEEVALERLSYLTISFKNPEYARRVARLFQAPWIRTIEGSDIYGAEYGAILKNIYALAVGMAHGAGFGDNFTAVLTCNALREMELFFEKTFPGERCVSDSVYLGDLLVTCYSQFSRNRTFGTMIGRGYSVSAAQAEMKMVAEGYYAASGIHAISGRHGLTLPIAEAVYKVLYEGLEPLEGLNSLRDKLR